MFKMIFYKKLLFLLSAILSCNIAYASSIDTSTKLKVLSATPTPSPSTTTTQVTEGGIPSQIGLNQLRIVDFNLSPSPTFVSFAVELNTLTKAHVYLGLDNIREKKPEYSDGFAKKHFFILSSLSPNKQYYYQIDFYDNTGARISTGIKTFFTSELSTDIIEQKNVSSFGIKVLDSGFQLSWDTVGISMNSYFRVIKSYKFYPSDPYDGIPIYEGRDNFFIDTNLIKNTEYFYTIFTCNNYGFCSSGVGVSSFFRKGGIGISVATSTPILPAEKVTLEKFIILENGVEILPEDGVYSLSGSFPIRLLIKTDAISIDHIKTILIDVYLDKDTLSSYLTKYNKETGYFETSEFYLRGKGGQDVNIKIFGLNKKIIYEKSIKFDSSQQPIPTSDVWALTFLEIPYIYWWVGILVLFDLLYLWYFWRR